MIGMSKIFGKTSHYWLSFFPTMVISHADVAEVSIYCEFLCGNSNRKFLFSHLENIIQH